MEVAPTIRTTQPQSHEKPAALPKHEVVTRISHASASACGCIGCWLGWAVGGAVCSYVLGYEGAVAGGVYGRHVAESYFGRVS